MKDRFLLRAVVVAAWLVSNAAGFAGENQSATKPSPEFDADRSALHLRIAARRAGTIVIVHRGASAFAPENSLAAYAAAMDYGADGCEVDLRRTRDGVLVLFHDDMLDHLTCGFGAVSQLTYVELVALRPQRQSGRALYGGAPTFAALLELAGQRAMLLHLDVKEPGLEDDIARQFDDADAWDHVVSINTYNTARLRTHPKLKLLALVEADFPDANQGEGDDTFQRRRPARIVERAWAAQQLGERGVKSKRVVAALERLVRERSLHKDWSYHGLDSSEMAAMLRSPNPAVRGTALLECIDYPTPPRRQALQAAAPWALELPPRK